MCFRYLQKHIQPGLAISTLKQLLSTTVIHIHRNDISIAAMNIIIHHCNMTTSRVGGT